MRSTLVLLRAVCFSCLPCLASVSGTVTDLHGRGLPGVEVSLAVESSSTTTNAAGWWSLGATTRIGARSVAIPSARWQGGAVELVLEEPSIVSIDAYDLAGAHRGGWSDLRLGAGMHRLPLSNHGSRVLQLRTSTTPSVASLAQVSKDLNAPARLAKSQAVPDTLRFTWQAKVVADIPLVRQDTNGILLRLDTSSGRRQSMHGPNPFRTNDRKQSFARCISHNRVPARRFARKAQ